MQKILKYIRKADQDYNLIQDGDVVAIGVSGGKDSMLLLAALHQYQKFKNKHFSLHAIHLKMGFPGMDTSPICEYCKQYDIPYHEEIVPIYNILQYYLKKDGSLDCSRCSQLKRGAIVQAAKRYGCNKIAFAHHGDDAIETLLMNVIQGGKISVFQPKIKYEDNQIQFIRPLIYVYEKDIVQSVHKLQLPIIQSTCPQDGNSNRAEIKQLLQCLYQKYPMAKNNLLHVLTNEKITLWEKEPK